MRRVIIVGNSSGVLAVENGKKIDSFDYVVRMGDSPRIQGYEKYVGTKTDMFRMKWFNFFNVESGTPQYMFGKKRNHFDINYSDILCIFHDPDYFSEIAPCFHRYEKNSLNRSLYYPVGNRIIHDFLIHDYSLSNKRWFFVNSIDIQELTCDIFKYTKNVKFTNGIEPSGGLCAIWYFLKYHANDELTITGFDGWKTGHYWKPDTPTFFSSHNGVCERIYIKHLLKQNRISIL
jgi:hypothetical protein